MQTPSATILLAVFLTALATGCGALLRISGSDSNTITFEAGELRSVEEVPIAELDPACGKAALSLGYEEVQATREKNRVLWTARTASGDPVELQLAAKYAKRTELRIRVGVLGNEARSRLLLEQIHQSL